VSLRLKLLACEILYREFCAVIARSPNRVDIEFLPKGLHDMGKEAMQRRLDDALAAVDESAYDAVLLGYGLCSNGVLGLSARSVPLVIPRAHDCITLFLGSRERYRDQFENHPGTYWYAHDYIERDDGAATSLSMGSGTDDDLQAVYDEYVAKYGRDNANYLMEVMGAWQSHYQRAVYIDMAIADGAAVEARAQAEAARRGWTFERVAGDLTLIRRLLAGDWVTDFLVVAAGEEVKMTYDEEILGSFCPFVSVPAA
jgi:Protein of unknown function (DUF1638)